MGALPEQSKEPRFSIYNSPSTLPRCVLEGLHQAQRLLGTGFFPLVAAATASILAARNCALLFGLGAMVGAWRLLGRGLGLAGASDEMEEEERVIGGERMDWTEDGREVIPVLDGVRVTGCLNWKEVGGGLSFSARRAALLFCLGPTTGGLVLITEIVSLRLCPGTPSKVSLLLFSEETCLTVFGAGGLMPILSAAALVMRGAMTGAVVDATAIDVDRLCPGTSMKACICCALVGATFGAFRVGSSNTIPARSAAALVVRGEMSGTRVVAGRGLARKTGLPLALR